MIPDQHKKKAAWVAICLGVLCGAEGVRQTAYRDVTGIPTICFGETKGVQMGDRKTLDECRDMLDGRLEEFAAKVDLCTHAELTPERKAAMVDFAYNVGPGAYCKFIAPKLNAGRTTDACSALLKFTKAGGIELPGLVKRRNAEYELCMKGLT